ncbi:asparaginyl-tRNA synthetase [Tilletia horrida]|nr:asparaginyl-tRNA synthetase [Tilletia horrida]
MIRRGAALGRTAAREAVASASTSVCVRCAALPLRHAAAASTSTSRWPLASTTRYYATGPATAAQSAVEAEDDELPWFMRESEPEAAPAQQQQQQPVPSAPETDLPPPHLCRTPELQRLHTLLTTGPIGKLVADASDLAEYDPDAPDANDDDARPDPAAEQPIIFLPTAAIAAALPPHEGAGVAYADWIILIRARTSAGGALGRIALEVGSFLKRTRPPASHARAHLDHVELRTGNHMGGELFGTTTREDKLALRASEHEFAELVIALEAWTRKHQMPSFFASRSAGSAADEALSLFPEDDGVVDSEADASALSLVSPVSALRSARIRRTYRATPITTISSATQEGKDAATAEDRGPRPAGWSRIEWDAGRRLPSWAIQKEALRRKLAAKAADGTGAQAKPFWRPGKILSRSAQEGLRTLHAYDPKGQFSTAELSRAFGISVESVRRILRAGGSRQRRGDGEGEEGEEQGGSLFGSDTSKPPLDLSDLRPRVPAWLARENEAIRSRSVVEGSEEAGAGADGVETVEQRQERRARERRAERVKRIVERISRERAAMDDNDAAEGEEGEDDEGQLKEDILGLRDDVPEHVIRQRYETRQLLGQMKKAESSDARAKKAKGEAMVGGKVEQVDELAQKVNAEEWDQPIHYEGLSPAQSHTLSSPSAAGSSSRPAFKSTRSALPSRSARAAKGDGDGNWVVVDAGWCVAHVLSEGGWDKFGPRGGVGGVWREWMGVVERERGWGRGADGRTNEVLAKAFGMGAKRGKVRGGGGGVRKLGR